MKTHEQDVETKIIDMLDALQSGAVTVGEKVVEYTPEAIDAALWVIRIDGIQSITSGLFLTALAGVGFYYVRKLLPWAKKTRSEAFVDGELAYVPVVMLALLSIFVAIEGVHKATCIWNWVAIFESKLAIAKRVIEATL